MRPWIEARIMVAIAILLCQDKPSLIICRPVKMANNKKI